LSSLRWRGWGDFAHVAARRGNRVAGRFRIGPYGEGRRCVCDCRGDLCVARGGVIQLPRHRWCRGGIGLRAINDRPYGEDRRCSGKDRRGRRSLQRKNAVRL